MQNEELIEELICELSTARQELLQAEKHIAELKAALRDFDAKHQYKTLRSIAARCEKGEDSYNLLHDLWKVMSEVNALAKLEDQ